MMLTANDCRRNAAAEGDPTLLLGPDMIHYAELLIRFHDHRVLSPGYQFWGSLADYLNRIMHLPEKPGRQSGSSWSEFNGAVAMAAGYVRDVSPATDEQKRELLRKFFPPANRTGEHQDQRDASETSTANWFAESKAAGCTGTGYSEDDDTIAHEGEMPCPLHPGL